MVDLASGDAVEIGRAHNTDLLLAEMDGVVDRAARFARRVQQ